VLRSLSVPATRIRLSDAGIHDVSAASDPKPEKIGPVRTNVLRAGVQPAEPDVVRKLEG
jgi:hypothetical protein